MEHDIRYQRPVRHIERPQRAVVPQRSDIAPPQKPRALPKPQNTERPQYDHPTLGKNGLIIKKKLRNLLHGPVAVYGMAFIIFGIGIVTSIQSMLINKTASDQVRVLSASSAESSGGGDTMPSGVPSEEEPKGDYKGTYKVAPSLPRLLAIPSIARHPHPMRGLHTS
jgi:hypothetical protein